MAVSNTECIRMISEASGISEHEAKELYDMARKAKAEAMATGNIANIEAQVGQWAKDHANTLKAAAAYNKKQAALNIMAGQRFEEKVRAFIAETGDHTEAIMARLTGSHKRAGGARESIDANRLAIYSDWMGSMTAEFKANPNLHDKLLRDKTFLDNVVREKYEIRQDGKPGVTGDEDARAVAAIFDKYTEIARQRANRAGAMIGKLDSWVPRRHDSARVMKTDRDTWIDEVLGYLDHKKTFGRDQAQIDALSTQKAALVKETEGVLAQEKAAKGKVLEAIIKRRRGIQTKLEELEISTEALRGEIKDKRAFLSEVYDNIVTGRDRGLSSTEQGKILGPGNMAKSMSKHRELHFKDADAELAYQEKYTKGNIYTSMIDHLDRMARKISVMEELGTNPETMLASKLEKLRREIREDPKLSPEQKAKKLKALNFDLGKRQGKIGMSFAQVMGETLIPERVTAAKIYQGVRSTMALAKLGGAALSAMADVVTRAVTMRYNGVNLFEAYRNVVQSFLEGRGSKEQKAVAYKLGVLWDTMNAEVSARWNAQDSMMGHSSLAMSRFFKWSGLNWITDVGKAASARLLASHWADNARKAFSQLSKTEQEILRYHGMTEKHWDAVRSVADFADDGRSYILAENMSKVPDAQIDALNADEIARIKKGLKLDEAKTSETKAKRQEQFDRRMDKLRADAREKLQTQWMAYILDETRHAVIEPGDRTRAAMVRGTRPGTLNGELLRFAMQFKSFPLAYMQNILREKRWRRPGTDNMDIGGMAHLVIASLAFGYLASLAKDLAKGRTPKDPSKIETWLQAATQSGGAGIYGDFFLGQYNRFGGGVSDSVIGPALSAAGRGVEILSGAVHGQSDWGDLGRLAMDNVPFINLWYTRAALDYAILFHLREMMSPGTLQRTEKRMKEQYNQSYVLPPSTVVRRGGGFK